MTKILELSVDPQTPLSGLDYLKTFAKRMLKTQLFMGTYVEKRFVQPLNAYRDVVKVHPDEKQFIENLLTVKDKAQRELSDFLPWFGITEPTAIGAPVGYCLWVVLPVEVFGSYWFQVKSVHCSTNEVRVKLEVIRSVIDPPQVTAPPLLAEPSTAVLQNVSQQISTNTSQFLTETFTLSNIKHSVIFLSLLLSTIVAGAINFIKYLLEFVLKFIREFSGLVKAFTPITLRCLDLLRRTVYGTFSFVLALIYGGRPKPVPPKQYHSTQFAQMIEYPNEVRLRRPNYSRRKPYRSSVTIEPLDDSY